MEENGNPDSTTETPAKNWPRKYVLLLSSGVLVVGLLIGSSLVFLSSSSKSGSSQNTQERHRGSTISSQQKKIDELREDIEFLRAANKRDRSHVGYVRIVEGPNGKYQVTDYVLNISFEYPKEWGELEIGTESTFGPDGKVQSPSMRTVKINGEIILAATIPHMHHPQRGGYWGDTADYVRNETFLLTGEGICSQIDDCRRSDTIAASGNKPAKTSFIYAVCTEGGCDEETTEQWYFYNPKSAFSSVVLTGERLRDEGVSDLDSSFRSLVESITFSI